MSSTKLAHRPSPALLALTLSAIAALTTTGARAQGSPPPGLPGTSTTSSSAPAPTTLGVAPGSPAAASAAEDAARLARSRQVKAPESHIPGRVMLELREVERAFDAALFQDCAPERCYSKGCTYVDHVTVDMPRTSSLPGLPAADEGPGSVAPQDYLTAARCEIAHEKGVAGRDIQALSRRLEQRLSRGFLKVTVAPLELEPVAKSLRESPAPPPEKAPEPPVEPEPVPVEDPPWTLGTALLELWQTVLPHVPWMTAIFLVTCAALILIWALRRLGRASLEEQLLASRLNNAGGAEGEGAEGDTALANANGAGDVDGDAHDDAKERAFAAEQEKLWSQRIDKEEKEPDGVFKGILRQWLREGELPLLARAVQLFGDRITLNFADADLAMKKVELAEYLRDVDEDALPSRADFFRRLNRHAISSALLAQTDVALYRSLREELGASGLVQLISALNPRYGAIAFALSAPDRQHDAVAIMSPQVRFRLAEELLESSRVAPEELTHLMRVLEATRGAQPLPKAPAEAGIGDRGIELHAAEALSVLLPTVSDDERSALFVQALARSNGVAPRWYEQIVFGDMLFKLEDEARKDLALEVDTRGLAAWVSLQSTEWQQKFLAGLPPSAREAVRSSMSFPSRDEQIRQAKRGHASLVTALQRRYVQGRLRFGELVLATSRPEPTQRMLRPGTVSTASLPAETNGE